MVGVETIVECRLHIILGATKHPKLFAVHGLLKLEDRFKRDSVGLVASVRGLVADEAEIFWFVHNVVVVKVMPPRLRRRGEILLSSGKAKLWETAG